MNIGSMAVDDEEAGVEEATASAKRDTDRSIPRRRRLAVDPVERREESAATSTAAGTGVGVLEVLDAATATFLLGPESFSLSDPEPDPLKLESEDPRRREGCAMCSSESESKPPNSTLRLMSCAICLASLTLGGQVGSPVGAEELASELNFFLRESGERSSSFVIA